MTTKLEAQFQAAYRSAVAIGTEKARELLNPESRIEVSPALVKLVHHQIFSDVYKDAEQTRKPGQNEIYIGTKKGVEPSKIDLALAGLCRSTNNALESPELSKKAAAIACFFLKAKEIQAFWDGNGRTAGLIAEALIKSHLLAHNPELQKSLVVSMDVSEYNRALVAGVEHHRPEPMINLVVGASGVGDRILAQENRTLSDALATAEMKEMCRTILESGPGERSVVRKYERELKAKEWLQQTSVREEEPSQPKTRSRDRDQER